MNFLKLNGIDKEYKSNTLSECAKRLNAPSAEGGLKNYYTDWEQAVENAKIATYTE